MRCAEEMGKVRRLTGRFQFATGGRGTSPSSDSPLPGSRVAAHAKRRKWLLPGGCSVRCAGVAGRQGGGGRALGGEVSNLYPLGAIHPGFQHGKSGGTEKDLGVEIKPIHGSTGPRRRVAEEEHLCSPRSAVSACLVHLSRPLRLPTPLLQPPSLHSSHSGHPLRPPSVSCFCILDLPPLLALPPSLLPPS